MLLGMRSAWKASMDSSPAEAVYGAALRLPGQFIPGVEATPATKDHFVADLQSRMRALALAPSEHHGTRTSYVPPSLQEAKAV